MTFFFSGFISFSYYLGILSYLYALPYPSFLFINTTGLFVYMLGGGLVRVDLLSLYVHTYIMR
jgi:hypothetical protein